MFENFIFFEKTIGFNVMFIIFLLHLLFVIILWSQYFSKKIFFWTSSSTSAAGGNQVDGLPPVWNNTETVAKPGRLGLAQNDEPMQNFVDLSSFWIITLMKAHSIFCPECIEDSCECFFFKMSKGNARARCMISLKFSNFEKWDFLIKLRKIWKFRIS